MRTTSLKMINKKKPSWEKIGKADHRHLAIFLKACEGYQIQSRKANTNNEWKDVKCPTFVDTMDYRVKPPVLVPKHIQFYGYWSDRTQSFFTTSRKLDEWKEKTYPRKPELDHIGIIYVPKS